MHGPGCHKSWGYDPPHTDSVRPYTLDELEGREEGPHRYAYPTTEAYLEGWYLWRALRRDSRLTAGERQAAGLVLESHLKELIEAYCLGDER